MLLGPHKRIDLTCDCPMRGMAAFSWTVRQPVVSTAYRRFRHESSKNIRIFRKSLREGANVVLVPLFNFLGVFPLVNLMNDHQIPFSAQRDGVQAADRVHP